MIDCLMIDLFCDGAGVLWGKTNTPDVAGSAVSVSGNARDVVCRGLLSLRWI
jgi:hypothetical protein